MKTQKAALPVRIFIDGAGQRPDGAGSGFAWLCESTGEKRIHTEDGLTNNQAEYKALLAALGELAPESEAEILTDSMVLAEQFSGRYKVRNPALLKLLGEARAVIAKNNLKIKISWIPREENPAGKLL